MSAADFQTQARMFAARAAARLREAATALDDAFPELVLPSDTMTAMEAVRSGMFDAFTCLGHASHQHALAVLHKEREQA